MVQPTQKIGGLNSNNITDFFLSTNNETADSFNLPGLSKLLTNQRPELNPINFQPINTTEQDYYPRNLPMNYDNVPLPIGGYGGGGFQSYGGGNLGGLFGGGGGGGGLGGLSSLTPTGWRNCSRYSRCWFRGKFFNEFIGG